MFAVAAQGQTTGDAPGSGGAGGKIGEEDWSFERKRLRGAESAALRADDQSRAGRGERDTSVHAGNRHRNFYAQARAAALGFRSSDVHIERDLMLPSFSVPEFGMSEGDGGNSIVG